MIKEMDELNNSIIEGIKHPLLVLDESLRIVKCNGQFQDIFQLGQGVGLVGVR